MLFVDYGTRPARSRTILFVDYGTRPALGRALLFEARKKTAKKSLQLVARYARLLL